MSTKFQLIECTDSKNHWRERVSSETHRDENIRNKDNEKDNGGVIMFSQAVMQPGSVFASQTEAAHP